MNEAKGVWDAYGGKWNHWPNPFTNQVEQLEILACTPTTQAKIKMAGIGFGNWFWSSFIPSPVEIVRKTVTGSYKCGFYMKGLKPGSPLDIVWRDKRTSKMLGELVRPVTTALWALWATETVWSAMSQFSSIVYMMEGCDNDQYTTMLRDGVGTFFIGYNQGGPALYTEMYDPLNRYTFGGGALNVFKKSNVTTSAYGYMDPRGHVMLDVSVGVSVNGRVRSKQSLGDINPGDRVPFEIGWGGTMNAGAIGLWVEATMLAGPALPAEIQIARWTSRIIDTTDEIDNGPEFQETDPPTDTLCQGPKVGRPWLGKLP